MHPRVFWACSSHFAGQGAHVFPPPRNVRSTDGGARGLNEVWGLMTPWGGSTLAVGFERASILIDFNQAPESLRPAFPASLRSPPPSHRRPAKESVGWIFFLLVAPVCGGRLPHNLGLKSSELWLMLQFFRSCHIFSYFFRDICDLEPRNSPKVKPPRFIFWSKFQGLQGASLF